MILDDVGNVTTVTATTGPTVDVNDAPTATGSNEWHSPRGMDHAQWSRIMTQFAMKHPLKDKNLEHSEIYFAKVLDT